MFKAIFYPRSCGHHRQTKYDKQLDLPWSSYKNGFTLTDGGYWLGLEQVHNLTSSASYRLLVDFTCSGASVWKSVEYPSFVIGDEINTRYTLNISG